MNHKRNSQLIFSNVAEGIHSENLTQILGETVSTKYLLGKFSTGKVAIAGASDQAFCVITDEGVLGDAVNVRLLGGAKTVKMIAAGAISQGAKVFGAASGKVSALPATAGTYYNVGIALNSASASGDVVEVLSHLPIAEVVSE